MFSLHDRRATGPQSQACRAPVERQFLRQSRRDFPQWPSEIARRRGRFFSRALLSLLPSTCFFIPILSLSLCPSERRESVVRKIFSERLLEKVTHALSEPSSCGWNSQPSQTPQKSRSLFKQAGRDRRRRKEKVNKKNISRSRDPKKTLRIDLSLLAPEMNQTTRPFFFSTISSSLSTDGSSS